MVAPLSPLEGFINPQDVRDSIAPQDFLALFDDENAGAVADENPALRRVLKQSLSEVRSNMAAIYAGSMPKELPERVSEILVTAQLAYAKFFAWERRPAYASKINPTMLKDLWKFAQDRMDRLKDAIQLIAPNDNPPPQSPSNVGGVVVNNGPRVCIDSPDGRSNLGDF